MNRPLFRRLAERILARALPEPEAWETVTVLLVNDRHMSSVHRACFGRAEATDVISVAYPPFPPVAPAWRGEVVLNMEHALREGRARGSVAREAALYLAHGCNHLNGSDDATPDQRARMRRRENRWLRHPEIRSLMEDVLNPRIPHA